MTRRNLFALLTVVLFAGTTASANLFLPESGSLADFLSLKPGIGLVTIEGTIADAREPVRQLKWLEDNDLVRAILVRVDSPGGGVTPSHEIYAELVRIRDEGTPVVVSMGTLAASGGYYISCPADVIVANPGTLTGSIGVIMEFPVLKEMMEKLGLGVEVIKSREHKDIGSPFRDMTERERELLREVVVDVYDQFVGIVSAERGLPEASVREIADGRIFTGSKALEYGLVDTIGTFEDAKRIAADLGDIKGDPRIIKPRRRVRSWLYEFLEGAAVRIIGLPRFPRLAYIWH